MGLKAAEAVNGGPPAYAVIRPGQKGWPRWAKEEGHAFSGSERGLPGVALDVGSEEQTLAYIREIMKGPEMQGLRLQVWDKETRVILHSIDS